MTQINWENVQIDTEKITADDIMAAEGRGRVPEGKYLCRCVSSTPREKNLEKYSCYAASLKWQVEEVREIDGQPADPDESAKYEGRFIFDDVFLHHPEEKQGMKNRRILIAKHCGLISDSTDEIASDMWSHGIIDKRAILTVERHTYTDKNDREKTTTRVPFAGYEYADGAPAVNEGDAYDDI